MKRCFISIDTPEEIKKDILKIQDQLPDFYGKKTESENLHLTLKFLGKIDEGKINDVKKELRKIEYNQFETSVNYVGFFDNVKRGKSYGPVWLHLSNCEELQKKVDDSLKDLFEPEKRFMSHLRIKSLKDKNYFLKELKKIEIPEIKFVVESFRLKESVLKPEGPVYRNIEVYKLI